MSKIYIGRYDKKRGEKRYVYYDSITHKRITAPLKDFKSEREFKHYIENKGYLFNTIIYKDKISEQKNRVFYSEIDAKRRITSGSYTDYKLMGKCTYHGKTYYAGSQYSPKKRIRRKQPFLKEQVIHNITMQILSNLVMQPNISGKNELTADEEEKFSVLSHYVAHNTEFFYKYVNYF